jgi:hypothetical protein
MNKDELNDLTADRIADCLNARCHDGKYDDSLDGWFQGDDTRGFRMYQGEITHFDGYTFGNKHDLIGDDAYEGLTPEQKALIPEDKSLFFLLGHLPDGGLPIYTHWLVEDARFAQKVACDWWDACEGAVLEEAGIDYDDVVEC